MSKRYYSFLVYLLLFSFFVTPLVFSQDLVSLKNLSWEEQKNRTRIILETNRPMQYNVTASQTSAEIQFESTNLDIRNLPQELYINTAEVISLQTSPLVAGQKARIVVKLTAFRPHQVSTDGNKVYIDVAGEGNSNLASPGPGYVEQVKDEPPIIVGSPQVTTVPTERIDPQQEKKSQVAKAEPAKIEKDPVLETLEDVSSGPATMIKDVQISPVEGNLVDVILLGDGFMDYDVFELTNPSRLVVDVKSVTVGPGVSIRQDNGQQVLTKVRVAQFQTVPKVARAVIDLNKKVPYFIEQEATQLTIHLGETFEMQSEVNDKKQGELRTAPQMKQPVPEPVIEKKVTMKPVTPAPSVAKPVNKTPVPATPAPISVKPEPVVAKPAPVVSQPAPAPVAAKPEPVAAQPVAQAPVSVKPEPVVAKPAPVVSQPAPAPVAAKPEPILSQPVSPAPIAKKPAQPVPATRKPATPVEIKPEPVTIQPPVSAPPVANPEPVAVQPTTSAPEVAKPEPVTAQPMTPPPTVAPEPVATQPAIEPAVIKPEPVTPQAVTPQPAAIPEPVAPQSVAPAPAPTVATTQQAVPQPATPEPAMVKPEPVTPEPAPVEPIVTKPESTQPANQAPVAPNPVAAPKYEEPKIAQVDAKQTSNEQFFTFKPDTSLFAQESTTIPTTNIPPQSSGTEGMGTLEDQQGGTQKQYTGEPFSFDFKDIDIKDLFRFIADISGLNVILDPTVRGSVTLKLTEVPWDQALDLITKNQGLGYTIEGNVIRIAPLSKIEAEEQQRMRVREAEFLSAPLVTRIIPINYAKANEVDVIVRRLLTKKGSSIIDRRTNMLIITDIDTNIDSIITLIETLDSRTLQVVIETRIVETTKNFSQAFGIQWGFRGIVDPAFGNNTTLQFPNNVLVAGDSLTPTTGVVGNPLGGYAVNLPTTQAPNSALLLSAGNILDTFRLDVALMALENSGQGRILSSPKIATQNNTRAEIVQGTQIPVQTIANNTVTTTYVQASLRMTVVPQITAEGTVIMEVEVENNRPNISILGIGGTPAIDTESARTTLLVEDGGTTVIGGIFTATENYQQGRTPVLHRIPLLGWLFKNTNVSRENRELLIFLTPRIIR